MVKIHLKKGDESQFLYETPVDTPVDDVIKDVTCIYNGRLKVQRLCADIEDLSLHGIVLPPNMQGLTDEQIIALKLHDEWADKCIPSGGAIDTKDKYGRRNGKAPNKQMQEVLNKTIQAAKDMISKKKVDANVPVTQATITEAISILKGAVTIVYPMGLPPHDTVRHELENTEDLSGTQASTEIIEEPNASLWWAGKEILRGKKLSDFVGKNDKTKIVAKIQKKGQGAPSREPVVSEEEQKKMMAYYYKKQEAMKKLEADSEDSYLDAAWADSNHLKRQFHGISNLKFR
ncbi:cilia- and flagella-associated protein 298-A [Patella vulgata]|uniref:cilia- and flagella-associated protein 298-A n=1 Tax=Patella vulgata TaxID=6465 RepID=UPI00217F5D0B|nr:cilia- and flagella-associated protein 298-A [Patella vulgata]XP_050393055.1 cilia- and flagella-associated protein 298-A [Patella vulgata]XP_050393056.1 cilia- and flagella-associated protein 298-A [Patella vulgata]